MGGVAIMQMIIEAIKIRSHDTFAHDHTFRTEISNLKPEIIIPARLSMPVSIHTPTSNQMPSITNRKLMGAAALALVGLGALVGFFSVADVAAGASGAPAFGRMERETKNQTQAMDQRPPDENMAALANNGNSALSVPVGVHPNEYCIGNQEDHKTDPTKDGYGTCTYARWRGCERKFCRGSGGVGSLLGPACGDYAPNRVYLQQGAAQAKVRDARGARQPLLRVLLLLPSVQLEEHKVYWLQQESHVRRLSQQYFAGRALAENRRTRALRRLEQKRAHLAGRMLKRNRRTCYAHMHIEPSRSATKE